MNLRWGARETFLTSAPPAIHGRLIESRVGRRPDRGRRLRQIYVSARWVQTRAEASAFRRRGAELWASSRQRAWFLFAALSPAQLLSIIAGPWQGRWRTSR